MQAAKRYLLIALTFTVALTTLAVLSPRAARAANNLVQMVLVTNTSSNPVPTTAVGTTNVAGSVGISGTPNMSVVNTPTVNIASMPAVTGTVSLSGTGTVQDADQPARQPFQATVTVNLNNFTYTSVPIPAGKRLVIEYVALAGASASSGGGVQPVILLNSDVAGSANALYYIQPVQSTAAPSQFYFNGPVTIYADNFSVGFGYAGFAPNFLVFNVVISGHLITP